MAMESKQSLEEKCNQLREELIQSVKDSIQIELKKLENIIASHSNRTLNTKSIIRELEDKINTINNSKETKNKKVKKK